MLLFEWQEKAPIFWANAPVNPGGVHRSLTDIGRIHILGLVVTICKNWVHARFDLKLARFFAIASGDGKKNQG